MTLKEAAKKVLSGSGKPMTAKQIHDEIVLQKLFTFRTKSGSQSVVTAMLKRHASGAHSCTPAKAKVFRLCAGDRYGLRP